MQPAPSVVTASVSLPLPAQQSPRSLANFPDVGSGKCPPSVLAFGDSLTSGWISGNDRTAPYTVRLKALLGQNVDNEGWAGETAQEMPPRLRKSLLGPRVRPLTHVVILAGTNDLRNNVAPEHVVTFLKNLYQIVHEAGLTCIAVTVPQVGPNDYAWNMLSDARQRINEGIRRCVAESAGLPNPLLLADFDAALSRIPAHERSALFVDQVHFYDRGYEVLADCVFQALRTAGPVNSPSQRYRQQPRMMPGAPQVKAGITQLPHRVIASSACMRPTPAAPTVVTSCSIVPGAVRQPAVAAPGSPQLLSSCALSMAARGRPVTVPANRFTVC